MIAAPQDDRAALHALNEEMGRALRAGPAPLASRGRDAADPLVICGLIGGKDVGKSSLVNALAEREVSHDREEIGEGTAGVVAYVHAADEEHLRARLTLMPASSAERVERIVAHDADALRGLALLDLPDVTSTFESHAALVRAAAPLLDRVLWLWDPILAGDRLYAERVGPVVKDHDNVWFALNKTDLLARDEARAGADPERLWEEWREWFASTARTASQRAGLGEQNGHIFLVAAGFPTREAFLDAVARAWGDPALQTHTQTRPILEHVAEGATADLERLRRRLLTPISAEDAARIKSANAAAEAAADREAIARHFNLDQLHQLADAAPASAAEDVAAHFDSTFIETIAARLARRGLSTTELAERVLAARVQHWPLLPAVYWLIRAPVRWLGRRILADGSGPRTDDLMRVGGLPLAHRIDGLLARITARQGRLFGLLREPPDLPDADRLAAAAQAGVEEAHEDVETEVVQECLARHKAPGPVRRGFIWAILAWFVLLQPLLEGLLRIVTTGEGSLALPLNMGALLRAATVLVTTLGATALLKGLAVTLLAYVLILMAMYGAAVREIRRARTGSRAPSQLADDQAASAQVYAQRVQAVLAETVLGPILSPLETLQRRVEGWRTRCEPDSPPPR